MDPKKVKNHCLKYLCSPNSHPSEPPLLSLQCDFILLYEFLHSLGFMQHWCILHLYLLSSGTVYSCAFSMSSLWSTRGRIQVQHIKTEPSSFPPNYDSFCIPCWSEWPYYLPTWARNLNAISDSLLFIALPTIQSQSLSILLPSHLSNPFSPLLLAPFLSFLPPLSPTPSPSPTPFLPLPLHPLLFHLFFLF